MLTEKTFGPITAQQALIPRIGKTFFYYRCHGGSIMNDNDRKRGIENKHKSEWCKEPQTVVLKFKLYIFSIYLLGFFYLVIVFFHFLSYS